MEPEGDCKPHCHWVAPDDVDTVRIDDVDPRSSSQGSKMTMSEDGAEADGGGAEADGRRAGKEERENFSSWFGESWATLERQTLKRSKRTARLEIRKRSDT